MISRLVFAFCLLPVIAAAQDQVLPDWVPAGIIAPEPFTVIQEMAIGSTHILIINVADDPSTLLPEWQAVLENAGYVLDTSMLFEQRILFSGNGLESAQIATRVSSENEGFDIQIDAKTVSK